MILENVNTERLQNNPRKLSSRKSYENIKINFISVKEKKSNNFTLRSKMIIDKLKGKKKSL